MPTQITTKQPVPLNPIPHLGYPNGCLDCKPFPCVSQPSSRSPILLQVPKFKIEKENYLRILFWRTRESRLRLSTEQWNGYKKIIRSRECPAGVTSEVDEICGGSGSDLPQCMATCHVSLSFTDHAVNSQQIPHTPQLLRWHSNPLTKLPFFFSANNKGIYIF